MTDADEVRNTLGRFCQALDERRFDDLADLFLPDGTFRPRRGREEIRAWIKSAELASNPELKRKHAVTNVVIEIDGDQARAVSDLTMFDKVGSRPWALVRVGRYTDRLVKTDDGRWLFAERVLEWMDD